LGDIILLILRFKGKIDEVLLFDIALKASQVLDLYGTEQLELSTYLSYKTN